jgi:DNA primase
MTALPDDAAELRRALDDPERLCTGLGLAENARRQRSGLLVLCPWHKERGPSCSVRRGPDGTVQVKCFGCGHTGDALSLIAAVLGLDITRNFGAVLTEASRIADLPLGQRAPQPRLGPAALSPLPDATFADLAALLLQLGRLDDGSLVADVTRYLAGRRLLDLARADGWAALPPAPVQRAWIAGLLREIFGADVIARSGLVRGDEFMEPAARLMIPWRDPTGTVATIQRRRLDKRRRAYVIPPGRSPRWPYGAHWLRDAPADVPVALVEGAVDALACRELAARRGRVVIPLGVPGVGAWMPRWADLARGRLALVAFDADAAGDAVVEEIAADLKVAGAIAVKRWRPRHGKDWADVLAAEAS